MPKSILTALRIATAFVVVAGFLALATTEEFDVTLVLIPLILFAIMPICEQLDAQYAGYRVVTTFLNIMVLPIVFAGPMFLGLLNAVIMLVIYIQVYLLLHRKRERDYYYLYLMAFFLLVATCVRSPEATVGVVMLVFLVSSVWAFLILQIYVETERNQSATAPDLLALNEQDYHVIAPPDRWMDAGVVLPVSALCVLSILLTSALFIFTPRMEAGFFGRREPAQAVTGLSSEVTIPTSGEIQSDPRLVLRAEFPDEPGGRYDGEFFWRSSAFDTYTGSRWIRRHLASNFDDRVPAPAYRSPVEETSATKTLVRNPSHNGRTVHQLIYLDDVPEEGLPCLSTVVRLDFAPPSKNMRISWGEDNDGSVRVASMRANSITYEAWSEVETSVSPGDLRTAPDEYERAIGPQDYRQLVEHNLTSSAVDLARQITADAPTVYDKVRAIERWFQSDLFAYSMVIPPLNPQQRIDDFILNVRVGHCQLYATAMTLMLRSLGIPSRVVSGYRGAEWVEGEDAYVVRADMAHLWVEVYFLDYGWFSFDPSPPVDRALTSMSGFKRWASLLALRAKMFWFREVVGFAGLQFTDIRSFSLGWINGDGSTSGSTRGIRSGGPVSTAALFVAAAITATIAYLFLSRRRRHRPGPTSLMSLHQLRARRLFFLMRRRLHQLGLTADGKTAEELEEAVAQYPPEPRHALVDALHMYNAARFGGGTLTSGQLTQLKNGLRHIKRQIAQG